MTEHGRQPHALVAAAANVLFAAGVIGAIASVLAWRGIPAAGRLGQIYLVVAVVVPVLYQLLLARRTAWVSPGESLVGYRCDEDGAKRWANPFGRSRYAQLAVQLLTLAVLASLWAGARGAQPPGLGGILIKAVVIVVLWRCLLHWGRGERVGAFVVAAYYLYHVGGLYAEASHRVVFPLLRETRPPGASLATLGVLAGATLVAALAYRRRD
jgi:hypothetical protein